MIQIFKSFFAIIMIALLSSFTLKNDTNLIGTYGVSSSDPSQIQLTLNADHTFYYQDFSVPSNKISIKGTWIQSGNKVLLNANDKAQKFHSKWTFDKNGQVAKSRKGLTFYRLGKY